ncbi:PFAM peptidase S1 and S6 [Fragilaria crotonensis]|nr:PFAM peptidase S1 and S6 [Fragilaria crotonensis]
MVGSALCVIAILLNLSSFVAIGASTQLDRNDHETNTSGRSLSTRIVGGDNADTTRYPYYTYLVMTTDDGPYRCGGTLIHPDIVLTAAHCYAELIHNGIKIFAISASVNKTSITEGRTGHEYNRNVVQLMVHPEYNVMTNANDVALFKLHEKVSGVPMPRLAQPGRTPRPGTRVKTIGLGLISESGMYASSLQVVDINVVSYRDCNDGDSYNGAVVPAAMICAGTSEVGKDACSGDSGGPLLRQNDSPDDDVIIGITSWGSGCGRAEKFGVYAKVSSYIGFIQKGICEMSSHILLSCVIHAPSAAPV